MEQLIEQMKTILGTTFGLYFKAHSYHWNIEGPDFAQYHDFLGNFYTAVFANVDPIAEHLRALDSYAHVALSRMLELSDVEETDIIPPALTMLLNLKKTLAPLTPVKLDQAFDWHLEQYKKIDHANFDMVIYSEDIQKNIDAITNLCGKLSWNLDSQYYTNYIDLITGKIINLDIDQFVSKITDNGSIAYSKIPNN